MLAFRGGDADAFDALFQRWAGPLLRHLERMVRDSATAEELVQETFLRVHRARERYAPEARFSTWLYRIATNLALNELRRPRRANPHASIDTHLDDRDAERPQLELVSGAPAPDDAAHARRAAAELERALAELPERQRTALWLAAGEGLSYAEVAAVLETSEKSVKSLVHRARAGLADRLGSLASARRARCGQRGEAE